MPLALRIIPRLDIKGPNLVEGVHLEGLRVLGKPESFAKYYYEQGEEHFWDVVNSWRAPHLWEKINGEWLFKYPIK